MEFSFVVEEHKRWDGQEGGITCQLVPTDDGKGTGPGVIGVRLTAADRETHGEKFAVGKVVTFVLK